jgi:CRISPR-associated endonuclease Cas1/CRISPR-associated protein Cas4
MAEPEDRSLAERVSDGQNPLIPARMLNEVVYCPRLYWLEQVAGEWDESADTLSGKRIHRRVDAGGAPLADPDALRNDLHVDARSVSVAAEGEGISATVDLVEAEGGRVTPVDYKRGKAPDPERVPGGVWPADRVQLGAQVVALRAVGYACEEGVVYYAASKTRVTVPFDELLQLEVRAAVAQARALLESTSPPPPLVDSPKCPRCSLVGICLPDETNLLAAESRREPKPKVPQILPAEQDRQPCHVQANGAVVGKDGETLQIRLRDGARQAVGLRRISHLSVYGQVQLTPGAIQGLCGEGVGVSFFSTGGWYYGSLGAIATASVHTRLAQFRAASDERTRVALARAFVRGKILNCRTLLRRNAASPPPATLARLRRLSHQASRVESLEALLGVEGSAARLYFEEFGKLLEPRSGVQVDYNFKGRNRRPPRDPVNALLSFAYALLLRDARLALLAAGFDPTVGFLHQPRPGRPGLALDLMEEFRPLVADSVVLTAINTEVVQPSDFVRAAGAVALGDRGRRAFLATYERRMGQEITHPLFGYRISYRRVLEVQARLLARVLGGELDRYPSFLTR